MTDHDEIRLEDFEAEVDGETRTRTLGVMLRVSVPEEGLAATKSNEADVTVENAEPTAVTVLGSASTATDDADSLSFDHETEDGPNRVLVVTAGNSDGNNGIVESISYGGDQLEKLADVRADGDDDPRGSVWYLVDPAVGDYEVSIEWAEDSEVAAGALTFGNVDQTDPISETAVDHGGDGDPNVTVASAENAAVMDMMVSAEDVDDVTTEPGPEQTKQWIGGMDSDGHILASSTADGDETVEMTWNGELDAEWGIIGFSINPV
ncbi:hypothetical protein [Natrarchaeobius chitinivorans]|uniref:hypothetical protein n=1 Tax=Natrarchaeobius chitinivorans TaxID=1679083 RepID=UPI000F524A5D|nr:hypothetical protein [Natrarchaeobius chitinivorans]